MVSEILFFTTILVSSCLGSFISCLSYRLPQSLSLLTPSYCPNCNHTLNMSHMIPLISWFLQRGKCRYCKSPISIRYPIIETITTMIMTYCLYLYGFNLSGIIMSGIILTLLVIAIIDSEHYIIPDILQAITLLLSIIYIYLFYKTILWQSISIGLLMSIVTLITSQILSHIIKKESLGWGDVKLFCTAGILLHSPTYIILFLFLAGISGVITGIIYKDKTFPFAPSMVLSLIISLFIQQNQIIFISTYLDVIWNL